MSKVVAEAREQVRERILSALGEAIAAGELPAEPMPAFGIEVPGDRAHGDLSANVAMVSARAFKRAPRQIADCIAAHLMLKGTYLEKAEVAGPGFLNFFLSPAFYADVVADVLDKREAYGRSDYGHGKKVMVEFVSANPTGPMHMGNARGGALGDCLAAVLEAGLIEGYLWDSSRFEGLFPQIISQLSLFARFYTIVNGVFDVTAIVYYLSVTGFFLFLSVQSLEKRRWSE